MTMAGQVEWKTGDEPAFDEGGAGSLYAPTACCSLQTAGQSATVCHRAGIHRASSRSPARSCWRMARAGHLFALSDGKLLIGGQEAVEMRTRSGAGPGERLARGTERTHAREGP